MAAATGRRGDERVKGEAPAGSGKRRTIDEAAGAMSDDERDRRPSRAGALAARGSDKSGQRELAMCTARHVLISPSFYLFKRLKKDQTHILGSLTQKNVGL